MKRLIILQKQYCLLFNIDEKKHIEEFKKKYNITSRKELTQEQIKNITSSYDLSIKLNIC